MVLSIIAVVFSLAGTGAASVATISALSKKEKTQTRRLADSEVNKLAPGLSVKSAGFATAAGSANTAASATDAENATNLGGKPPSSYEESAFATYAESNLTLSTDSGTPTTLNTLTLPGPASYLVQANASMFNSGSACVASFDLRRDGTSVSFNQVGSDAGNAQSTYSAERLLTVGSSATITVTGYRQVGTGTCTAYSRSLVAQQVDNATGAL
jgi:hypothetical protein